MKALFLTILVSICGTIAAKAATCTIASTSTWSTCVCQETSAAPQSGDAVVVNSGVTLTLNNGGFTSFTGTLTIYGTLINSKANAVWNGTVTIKNGGQLTLQDKLDIGSSAGCGYTLVVENGGNLDLTGSGGSDLLSICGQKVAQSGGSCSTYPNLPLPYCEPSGGFTGPFVFNQGGLPIELLYFNVSIPKNENQTLIEWATEEEFDFDHFEIQRANKDLEFSTILEEPGAGYNTSSVKKYTAYDENPLVGIGYYRLKAVDIDGTVEYFKVKSVNYNGNRKLLVSPNPVSGTSIKYTLNFDPGPYDRVTLINQVGTELVSTPVTAIENELVLDSKLRPGAYLLRYSSPTFQYVARVFIKD